MVSVMSGALKKTTALTGLAVSHKPHLELKILYEKILRFTRLLPEGYAYRKFVENLVKERTEILQRNKDVAAIEQKIGQGQIEQLIVHARNELSLVHKIAEGKPWESLVEKAPPHQWTWPPHK